MNPFGQMKNLYKLQKQARDMQKQMKKTYGKGESSKGLIQLVINGVGEIVELAIDDSLLDVDKKEVLVSHLKKAMKSAQKNLQKQLASQVNVSDLQNMLGGM